MKKIFTFVIVLMTANITAIAQSFEFKYHGVTIENGEGVSIAAEQDMFGDLSCETNPSSDPSNGLVLVGADGASVSGMAHLEILEHTFKAKTIQWCMGGACVPLKGVTQYDKEFEGTTVLTQFDAFTIRQEGYLLASLEVNVNGETSKIYIEFTNGQTSGINVIKDPKGLIDVYDLNGRLVMQQADVNARQLLRKGIYVVKEGNKTRKVMF